MKSFIQLWVLLATAITLVSASPIVDVIRSTDDLISMKARRTMAFEYRDMELAKKAVVDPIQIGTYSLETNFNDDLLFS